MALQQHLAETKSQLESLLAHKAEAIKQYNEREQNLLTVLMLLNEAKEDDLLALYRSGVVTPPMDTDEKMREAFWKYYSDTNIANFGCAAAVEYKRTLDNGKDDPVQFTHLFPEKFESSNPSKYKWTRDDIKKFVEGVPNEILVGIGY